MPEIIASIMRHGPEIGNHSWSHARLVVRSASFVRDEIGKTDALLRQLGYHGEIHFRAPYGRKLYVLPKILDERQCMYVLFDVSELMALDAESDMSGALVMAKANSN